MASIRLNNGAEAVVDDEFSHLSAWRWGAWKNPDIRGCYAGRMVRAADGKQLAVYLHHAVIGRPIDRSLVVDHINGNALDCRAANLRIVDRRSNCANSWGRRIGKFKSRFFGVIRERETWAASIRNNGKRLRIGGFRTEEAAGRAYQKLLTFLSGR